MDQSNRPKTRGLEAYEAEEDARLVKAALKEPSKYVKRAHQKLKSDYGKGEDSDEEDKLFYQQPPFEEEETEPKPGSKRKRGGGRRGGRRKKGGGDGGHEEEMKRPVSAKLAALLKEELKPKIVPWTCSSIEYKQIWYKLGDIVSVQREETKYFAQILGFHTDQFCDRYASIRWLIPRWKIDDDDLHQPPVTVETFKGSVPEEDPVHMDCFSFIHRPPAHYFQPEHPSTVTRNKFFVFNNTKCYFDSPSPTLTSAERRY